MISDEVRRFVLTSIPSIPYLEAALLFCHAPTIELDAAELARALYLHESGARDLLESLCAAGLVASNSDSPPRYGFAPRDEALRLALLSLAEAYPTNVIAITNMIHDTVGRSAHRFADAFKIRKE